ncbi:MAG: hypothetical protein JNJ88_07320 [Planctomycetes bacterium]|nr:hypothetical protein [Planctomycetota bacterium]
MDQAVRPCLRCDALVEESRAYCPQCGASMTHVQLVLARPASASAAAEDSALVGVFEVILALLGLIGMAALAAALYGAL